MTVAVLPLAIAAVTIRCRGPVDYDGKGNLLFRDDVRVEADELKIECDVLRTELDEEGSPTRLVFEGGVTAAGEWFEGACEAAEYEVKTRVLQMSGPVRMLLKRKVKKKKKKEVEAEKEPAEETEPKEKEQELKLACSRRASVRRKDREGRLEGDCVVEFEGAILRADVVDFAYADAEGGALLRACASNARLEFGKRRGRAQTARYDAESQTIELEGDPVLEQDGASITAPGMRIHLEEGRIVPVGGEFRVLRK